MNENRPVPVADAADAGAAFAAQYRHQAQTTPEPRPTPLFCLRKLRREFKSGEETIVALNDIDLDIARGEMVAIVGSSGSGKSTLMNVLGCLDQGFSGGYSFDGRDIRAFGIDELAELRREHFGFIFQRYQLLSDLDAVENVELPSVYSGVRGGVRHERARALLARLGLGDRMRHRPNAMSGGQQQRVSVARALMNGGEVIFADEPTGALDSHTGAELLKLLHQLNSEGHTIIVVTHEKGLAESLPRRIEISDGGIISDTRSGATDRPVPSRPASLKRNWGWIDSVSRVFQAFSIATRAMMSHKLRTFLTMLGIIIGIASVVSMVGLGQGTQDRVLSNINSMGTNTINVYSGQGFRDRGGPRVETLTASDAKAIAQLPVADSVTPRASSNGTALYRNISASVSMNGVGDQYFRVSGLSLIDGVTFDGESVDTLAQEVVIDTTTRDTFFTNGEEALGQVLLVGKLPLRVIGVVKASSGGFGPSASQLNIYAPYTTVMSRVLGQSFLSNITVRVKDDASMTDAETQITNLLLARHRTQDFTLMNTDTIRETIESTTQMLTLFISAIALISLIVGGIGVMNIMLVSVTERTREIGVRLAIGARRGDIMRQFLIEAVLVCIVGGGIGVSLSLGISILVPMIASGFTVPFSPMTVALAFASSTLIGVVFGFMPARSAARLDPVEALAFE